MAVTFDPMPGYPVYFGSLQELRATLVGLIPWTDINNHFLELFPPAIAGVPQLPTLLNGSAYLYADSVEYEPYTGDSGGTFDGSVVPPTYDQAKATIHFKSIPYSEENNQIVTRRISMGGEMLLLPNTKLYWSGSPPTQVSNNAVQAGKFIPMLEHQLTFHRVLVPMYSAMRASIGTLNNATFEGATTGSLLYLGAELQQTKMSDGSAPWQIDHRFAERIIDGNTSIGWNYFFDPDAGTWRQLQTLSGAKLYLTSNFGNLY